MNKSGVASPITILTLLEETAADHCYSIDYSLYDLEKQNVGWILLSGFMQMERYPGYKEKITIRTWLSTFSTIKGIRENIIYDEQGTVIGRAKGLWLFFDIGKRRPLQIFDEIRDKWSFCKDESIEKDISCKLGVLDTAGYMHEFCINRYDTDTNKHVNNIRYLQWVIESIPDETIDNYYLHSIDGRFIGEAQLGDTIISLTEEDAADHSFIHTIKIKGSNKVCATAKTVWKRNQG